MRVLKLLALVAILTFSVAACDSADNDRTPIEDVSSSARYSVMVETPRDQYAPCVPVAYVFPKTFDIAEVDLNDIWLTGSTTLPDEINSSSQLWVGCIFELQGVPDSSEVQTFSEFQVGPATHSYVTWNADKTFRLTNRFQREWYYDTGESFYFQTFAERKFVETGTPSYNFFVSDIRGKDGEKKGNVDNIVAILVMTPVDIKKEGVTRATLSVRSQVKIPGGYRWVNSMTSIPFTLTVNDIHNVVANQLAGEGEGSSLIKWRSSASPMRTRQN